MNRHDPPRSHAEQDPLLCARSDGGGGGQAAPSGRRRHAVSPARGGLLAGILAVGWILLRSGSKPSRAAYPCQQAAFSTASLVFGGSVVAAAVAIGRRLRAPRPSLAGIALAAGGLAGTLALWVTLSGASGGDTASAPQGAPPGFPAAERSSVSASGWAPAPASDYRAKVYHVSGCAQNPVGDRFPGLDDLVETMGANGLKLYRSPVVSLVAGPDGIIAADDVVIIKINYQWPERGGTSTDLLRGLIGRILDHPDTFTGEVVVCENAQFNSTQSFDRTQNNAQDTHQSPRDVVAHFQGLGRKVSLYDWTPLRYTQVAEYSAGDDVDGYILYPYDSTLQGRISYPKFRTANGARISLKHGIWSPGTGYDRARLKFINVPVLKSHHSTYGATAAVKSYMGVVSRELGTNSHGAILYGILGALIGEIGPADLNILDAIWINANPNLGPSTSYVNATRRDELAASRDPVALDIWSVKNILIPAFLANGYTPPWPNPSADPDNSSSMFRRYLDASMARLIAAGVEVTNDPARIDLIDTVPPGEASDPLGTGTPFTIGKRPGGFELTWSRPQRGGPVGNYVLYRTHLAGPRDAASPECECALGNATTAFLPTLSDNCGFILAARNGAGDGSFGGDSRGRERPRPAPGAACP